jgi:hypothetical protein
MLADAVEPSLAQTFPALKFDPVQGLDRDSVWRWRQSGQTGMMIEFLTPSFDAEEGIRDLPALGVKARALHHLNYLISDPMSTAETKPATWRRKSRPVAGCQAPWRVRSPNSWRVPWRIGPEGQFCNV